MSKRIWNRIKREGLINEIRRLRVKFLFLKKDVYNFFGLKSINKDLSLKYVKSFYGPLMYENWDDITFRFCIRGSYGTVFSDYLKKYAKPFCFIDIGANQGLYSLIAGSNENCRKIIAFEPIPKTADLLSINLDCNQLANISEVHVRAISNENSYRSIYINVDHSGRSNIDQLSSDRQNTEVVDIETVDSRYFSGLKIPNDLDIIVKVDTEGHEKIVIDQLMRSAISNQTSAIYYEHDTDFQEDMDHVENLLKNNGFLNFLSVKDEETKNLFNVLCVKG